MSVLNKSCHYCFGFYRPNKDYPDWLACDCGVRVYRGYKMSALKLEDLITSSGKYPERALSAECTQEVKDNGVRLLNAVNQLLVELQATDGITISSGFRTSEANSALPNSAKRSNHMKGLAVDLHDPENKLDTLFSENIETLEKYGLYLESPVSTPHWSHLQIVKTHNNPFIP